MRVVPLLIVLLAGGCEPIDPSGDLLAPVVEAEPAPAAAPEAQPQPEEYDFEADERAEEGEAPRELQPDEVAASLGIEVPPEAPPEEDAVAEVGETETPEVPVPEVVPPELPPPPEVMPAPSPEAGWNVEVPLEGSWGVRVVAVLVDAQPPRAILGLSDGTEKVVEPGTLLPEAGLVVMAIGRDAVQLAEVVPKGDHVRIESHVVQPMYGQTHIER